MSGNFNSILCGSAYGMREFRLPSGEEHRLRFIVPMKEHDITALMKKKDSPFYHPQLSKDAQGFLNLTGCMPRDTLRIINGIDPQLSLPNTRKALENWKNELITEKVDIIEKKWWQLALKAKIDTRSLLATLQSVIRGYERFVIVSKNLYDYGLVYLEPETKRLKPVSEMAVISLQYFYAREFEKEVQSVSVVLHKDGASSGGSNFQQQIEQSIVRIIPPFSVNATLCKDANVIKSLRMDAIISKFFDAKDLGLVKIHPTMRILWLPENKSEDFDCILTPSADEEEGANVLVMDPSITDPFSTNGNPSRVDKMKKLAGKDYSEKLKSMLGRDVCVVMFWNDKRENATKSQLKTTHTFPDNSYLVDGPEVAKMGVKL